MEKSSAIETFLRHSKCGKLVDELYPTKSIRLLYDTLVVKEAHCDLTFNWHVDYPAWPLENSEVTTV